MEKLSSILARIQVPGPGPMHRRQILEALRAELGAAAARDLHVASYRCGKLVLDCSSAARAFEWQAFAGGDLAERLKRRAGLESLSQVQVRNGAWRRNVRQ
jgi:hypothetical protein